MRMNCGLCIEDGEERTVSHIRFSLNNFSIALLTYLFVHSLQSEFLFLLFITEFDAHLERMSVETHWHKSGMVYIWTLLPTQSLQLSSEPAPLVTSVGDEI